MSGRYLLDTNVVIALFADESNVKSHFDEAEEIFLPSIARGELYYGAYKSRWVERNTKQIEEFAAQSVVLNCNADTARRYGEIKNGLRQKDYSVPENDIWIAAIAIENDLTVVTYGVRPQKRDFLICSLTFVILGEIR